MLLIVIAVIALIIPLPLTNAVPIIVHRTLFVAFVKYQRPIF